MKQKKDNSSKDKKIQLRKRGLSELDKPIVMETHAGTGRIYKECYETRVETGVCFEIDEPKADILAAQRPHWFVYEGDNEYCIRQGVGASLEINFFDLDPYGQPWGVIDALFESERPFPDKIVLAVQDGLRQKLATNSGWQIKNIRPAIEKWGNISLYDNYLEVAQYLLEQQAVKQGYNLTKWGGYYCGTNDDLTHYLAVLEKNADSR